MLKGDLDFHMTEYLTLTTFMYHYKNYSSTILMIDSEYIFRDKEEWIFISPLKSISFCSYDSDAYLVSHSWILK